jgi:hypothetical protein
LRLEYYLVADSLANFPWSLLFDKSLVNSPAKWLTSLLNYLSHRSALADYQ